MVFYLLYEKGVIKKDWRYVDLSFGLIYPNHYELGISSYSIRLIYSIINNEKNFVCERFFLPEKIKYPASEDYFSKEIIRSFENSNLPNDFDILGFSIHFENDFKNILWFLDKAKIPFYSDIRYKLNNENHHKYPLIVGGGPAVTSNPLPLSKIFDCFFIGDAEPNLYPFLNKYIEYKANTINYSQFFEGLKNIEGIFIPKCNNSVKRMVLKNLDESPAPIFQLVVSSDSKKQIFEQNYFIEINRGCPFKCKFCISSFHNYPFRNRSYEKIAEIVDNAIELTDFQKFSLIGSCVSSHPKFLKILNYIIEKGKKFSVPSIRIDHITPQLIEVFEKSNIKTITIAPETGLDSLRFEIGKKITNDKVIEVLNLIKASKIKNVKFYFLIGLPNENDEEIEGIIDLMKNIDKIGFNKNQLKVNINPFIPKLNTPYQSSCCFYTSENFNSLKLRFQKLERELRPIKSINLKIGDIRKEVDDAKLQTLISLGNENITDLMINYYLRGATRGALRAVEKELNFDTDDYFKKIQNGYNPWTIGIIEK